MTYDTFCQHIKTILIEYDFATGNKRADNVLSHPENWVDFIGAPAYASIAALLIEERTKRDLKIVSRARRNAIKHIIDNVPHHRPAMQGITKYEGYYLVCDGYRLIRMHSDLSSLPHTNGDFSILEQVIKDMGPATDEVLTLPTVGELETFIAVNKRRHGKRMVCSEPYCLNDFVWCNPKYLLDMIQALPGCTAYKPAKAIDPIYFSSFNGDDGLLLPVRLPCE